MDHLGALACSTDRLRQCLKLITAESLGLPSSCLGWSVYDLANHVIGGGHRYLLLLQGADADDLVETRIQDHVGDDPVQSHRNWAELLKAAFAEPGSFDRTVHHPDGERTGLDLLRMRVLEQTLHGWDLSVSLAESEQIDEDLSTYLLDECAGLLTNLRTVGRYAAPQDEDQDDDPSTRLLHFAGRSHRRALDTICCGNAERSNER
ncbi:MAG TPA: TIGR03086 family metal-binding protein [Arthrobacter sp.]|nr:TIGR03086 family metal-binding protein [Arthrobacter sp.]